ncbi:hypothetical protein K505DRAFT_79148 [Melanomma pulvis-pyrius CBS 109.77]|uniref:YDG domain-containing protein n=1 Tax=Melanomma pulvis-pyrius CBS 109.77 TaxID=1314802 RepID=A0A6A6X2S0_9PLEO|nr:hypothetical protein K505DRAFT_79148 [Melanomma pulvis-pyrius CBS 109.77]
MSLPYAHAPAQGSPLPPSLSLNDGKGLARIKSHRNDLTEMVIWGSEQERESLVSQLLVVKADCFGHSWWLNPLFAYHAGIIDLDSTEGGICFDKYGAYAVLLKDTGEVDASSEASITYRCRDNDQGRFRLTSATSRSRLPIRILRSHSLSSIWGPKAGVRYEGLYRVSGWTIRPVKNIDFGGSQHNIGDIMYEVKFERDDPVSMGEVIQHPTKFELDDYAEYKRLRRVHREGQPHIAVAKTGKANLHVIAKAAPPIQPLAAPTSQLPALSQAKVPQTVTRSTTFNIPLAAIQGWSGPSRLPPEADPFFGLHKNPLEVSTATSMRAGTNTQSPINDSPQSEPSFQSNISSTRTINGNVEEIREVAPWIDFDPELRTPTPINHLRSASTSIQRGSIRTPSRGGTVRSRPTSKDPSPDLRESPNAGTTHKRGLISWEPKDPGLTRKKDARKKDSQLSVMTPFTRNRNPLAKLFDGTEEDFFSYKQTRGVSLSPKSTTRMAQRHLRSSSSDATVRLLSPVPTRPLSPTSPLITHRRDAICPPYSLDYISVTGTFEISEPPSRTSSSFHDPFIEPPALAASHKAKSQRSLPVSLKDFISKPRTATPVSVSPAYETPGSELFSRSVRGRNDSNFGGGEREGSVARQQLRAMFKNPFKETRDRDAEGRSRKFSNESVEVLAPDATP